MIDVTPKNSDIERTLILYSRLMDKTKKEGKTPRNMAPVSTCTGVAAVNHLYEL